MVCLHIPLCPSRKQTIQKIPPRPHFARRKAPLTPLAQTSPFLLSFCARTIFKRCFVVFKRGLTIPPAPISGLEGKNG